MAAEYGFVYFLSNESMPGIYKVGFTTKHPKTRMAELSRATGCPEPFELLAYIGVDDASNMEHCIHTDLDEYRLNKSREFFKVDLRVLSKLIDAYGCARHDAVYTRLLDDMISVEDYERSAEQ